jgi:hypothetical protein
LLELGREVVFLRVLDLVVPDQLSESQQEQHAGEMHADALVGAAVERNPHEVVFAVLADLFGEPPMSLAVDRLELLPMPSGAMWPDPLAYCAASGA